MPDTPAEPPREKPLLPVAVRTLVDFTERSGDLDLTLRGGPSALEGIRAHQAVQRGRPDGYRPEVAVSGHWETESCILALTGRVDGVWADGARTVVEEIKTTAADLRTIGPDGRPIHWSQLMVYAWLLARSEDLGAVEGLLTYYRHGTGELLECRRGLDLDTLEAAVAGMADRYVAWANQLHRWRQRRDRSLRCLPFPHPSYRPGQRPMAVAVYRTVREGGRILVQAPTGIGKTMAVVFPTLKAVGEGWADRWFYLTARTTGRTAAEDALERLRGSGLRFRALSLTAKDKLCTYPDAACSPEECDVAKGHFDRLNDALWAAMEVEALTRETVAELARRHRICPFAFSLELSEWVDGIVCDYNYAFDPRVHLRHLFQDAALPAVFAVDEAHNLVDRSREMFSAEIRRQPFLEVRRPLRGALPGLHRTLGRIARWLAEARKAAESEGGSRTDPEPPDGLAPLLREAVLAADRWLVRNEKPPWRKELLDLYFTMTAFLRIREGYGPHYATCCEADGRDVRLRLFCIDPSAPLGAALERARTAIFFSATLTPPDYFRRLFGCEEDTPFLRIPSPYPRGHLRLLVDAGTSTYFRDRARTAGRVAEAIRALCAARRGNYLCFFPSYAYLQMVHDAFGAGGPGWEILVQTPSMAEAEREAFLARFDAENPGRLVGFAVLGGVFGEGIDLAGERLCGAVVVGVGLPGPSPERELVRTYFQEKLAAGFEYAYQYPGMNRVLQAAGRVIRSETDRGVVLLVDRRYASARYRRLFPDEWRPVGLPDAGGIARHVSAFWSDAGGAAPGDGAPDGKDPPNGEEAPP